MLTVGPAELGDGVDEAVVEVGRPSEPGLGVGRQHHAGPSAVPLQPQPAAAARRVLDGAGVGATTAAGVVDQAGEHLPCRDLTCAFGGLAAAAPPRPKARDGEREERSKLFSVGCRCSSSLFSSHFSCLSCSLLADRLTLSE
jgi:hypothetical protein